MKITNEQRRIIQKVMVNIDEWIAKGYDEFMDELYGLILETFKNDEPTDISYELEKVYDEIVYQNKENK